MTLPIRPALIAALAFLAGMLTMVLCVLPVQWCERER